MFKKLLSKIPFLQKKKTYKGLACQFGEPTHLLEAVKGLKELGLSNIEVYTPYPIHGLEKVLDLPRSKVPWITLIAGFVGFLAALLMQWWMSAVSYKINIGGKPFFSGPAFVPIIFEVTVLFAALATFVGLWVFCGLPKFESPFENDERALRSTNDEFTLYICTGDPLFDESKIRDVLSSKKCFDIRYLGEEE